MSQIYQSLKFIELFESNINEDNIQYNKWLNEKFFLTLYRKTYINNKGITLPSTFKDDVDVGIFDNVHEALQYASENYVAYSFSVFYMKLINEHMHVHRSNEGFLFTKGLGFDMDNGKITIDDSIKYNTENKYKSVIWPTKSHQIAKNNDAACDRFRIGLEFEEILSRSNKDYVKKIYQYYGSQFVNNEYDAKCNDLARFFWTSEHDLIKLNGNQL
ncbi:unnamed protein product, partial [marine sediment metagenome]